MVAPSASRCGEHSLLIDGFFLLQLRNSTAVPAFKNAKAFLQRKLTLDAIRIISMSFTQKGQLWLHSQKQMGTENPSRCCTAISQLQSKADSEGALANTATTSTLIKRAVTRVLIHHQPTGFSGKRVANCSPLQASVWAPERRLCLPWADIGERFPFCIQARGSR